MIPRKIPARPSRDKKRTGQKLKDIFPVDCHNLGIGPGALLNFVRLFAIKASSEACCSYILRQLAVVGYKEVFLIDHFCPSGGTTPPRLKEGFCLTSAF